MKTLCSLIMSLSIAHSQYANISSYTSIVLDWDPSQFDVSDPSTWKPIVGPYKMGTLVTCLEQNDENPYGYKEKYTYGDPSGESDVCQASPELCARYQDKDIDPVFGGTGDVCDHEDPLVYDENGNRLVRDVCKFSVMFLPEIDDEKSWAWKCARHEICPLKNMDEFYYDKNGEKVIGAGRMGCLINDKRVQCCCEGDYCQGNELYAKYARYGNPEFYPINFQALANIDPGDEIVEYDLPDDIIIPDWDCIHRGECPMPSNATTDTVTVEDIENEIAEIEDEIDQITEYEIPVVFNPFVDVVSLSPAKSESNVLKFDGVEKNNEPVLYQTKDVLLIFGLFVTGLLCLGIGLFVGIQSGKRALNKPLKFVKNDF